MSLTRKIAHNTAIQMGGKAIGTVLSLIVAGMLLRYLGADGFGKYTGTISFLQIFGILIDMGLYIILIKRIAVVNEKTAPLVNNIVTMRVASGVIFLSLAPIAAWLASARVAFYTPEIIAAIALTSFFFLFISLNQLLSAIFQKYLRTDWIALGEFIGKLVLLIATIIVVAAGASFLWVMSTLVLSAAANFLVNFWASRKYFKIKPAFDWVIWRAVLKDAWPIGLSIAFSLLYFKGDAVLLTFFEDEATVGVYGAPYKILEVLVTFPAMFVGLVLPPLSKAWEERNTQRFQSLLQKSFDALVLFAVPMAVGGIVLAEPIMQILAGDVSAGPDSFGRSVEMLQILIIPTAAIYLGTLFGYAVPALNKQRTMMWMYLLVAVTSLGAYLYVIPRYSIHGAAYVTLYSEILVMLLAMWIVLRTARIRLAFMRVAKAALAAGGMWVALWFAVRAWPSDIFSALPNAVLELAVLIPLGALTYLMVLFLLGGIRKADIQDIIRLRS